MECIAGWVGRGAKVGIVPASKKDKIERSGIPIFIGKAVLLALFW